MTNNFNRDVAMIKDCYDHPMFAPQFHWNAKYLTSDFQNTIPYICINDLINYKYVICAIPFEEASMMLMEMNRRTVIKEYDSIESMVEDGWRLD